MIRSLDILERWATAIKEDRIGQLLEQHKADSEAIPARARQQLFDDWFAGGYEEGRVVSGR
jgi:hypothetical protein